MGLGAKGLLKSKAWHRHKLVILLGFDAYQCAPLFEGGFIFFQMVDIQLTGEQVVKADRSICTIREFEERVHKEFATG